MTEYVVLAPISLDSGPVILPAEPGEPPTIVTDDELFENPSEFLTNEERAKMLIDRHIIKVATARQSAKAAATEAAALDTPPEPKEN